MSKTTEILGFVLRWVSAGLAIAFIALYLWPRFNAESASGERPAAVSLPPAPASYATAVDRAAPAVVSIYTMTLTTPEASGGIANLRLFNMTQDMGSGIVMTPDGYILTNFHVIEGVQNIRVSLWDGRIADAYVIGSDPATDLAVLKVDLDGLPVAPINEQTVVRVGDVVLAIGNALGLSHTVTMGIVSATQRNDQRASPFENFIQTDAAFNPGNSGGALINANGELVGINTRTQSRNRELAQNIGFAIPIGQAREVMEQIIEYGTVQRSWLGAVFGDGRVQQLADGTGARQGVVVREVARSGPAWEAGIRQGDVVLSVDGVEFDDATLFNLEIARRSPGDSVELKVRRRGEDFQTYATLRQLPPL